MAVTNLQFVCKTITCASTEMAIIFNQVWTLCVAGYAKDAIVGACHRTIDQQEHKIICRAGPEQDTIFHLRVTACREQGNHCRDERLAGVASRRQGTSCSSSFVSKVLGANYNRAIITTFILWLINSPCARTGSNL